jgi:malonyl-CoA O-methyltransferase
MFNGMDRCKVAVNKKQVEKNFRRSAASYDAYAVFQKDAAFALMQKIKAGGKNYRQILEIGCGTGFLTKLLAEEYPQAMILATDIAPEMIGVAKAKLAQWQNVVYSVADGENLVIPAGNAYDLITSNMVFQWFNDYLLPFSRYYQSLNNAGCLIFSTLGEGTFSELYSCLRQTYAKKGNENALSKRKLFIKKDVLAVTMHQAGFTEIEIVADLRQEFYPSCRDFLRSLKKTGADSYLMDSLAKTQGLGPEIFKLIMEYDSRFRSNQGVYASYHCLYGYGRK